MKELQIPDLKNQPKCKSIVSENISNVERGKALTAPLSFLNQSCEFRSAWNKFCKIVHKGYPVMKRCVVCNSEFESRYRKNICSDKCLKVRRNKCSKKYYQENKIKSKNKSKEYYLKNKLKVKARNKEYYQRKKKNIVMPREGNDS